MVSAKLAEQLAQIEQWKDLTLSADFPDAADRPWP
jgi:hypothetical protein